MSIENWNEDSILSRAGYKADGSQSQRSRVFCIDRAIAGREENALEVLRHLRWLIDDRGDRFPRAKLRWLEDLAYVSRLINCGLDGDPAEVELHVMQLRIQQHVRNRRAKDIFEGRKRQTQVSEVYF